MQKIRPSRSQLSEVGESGGFGIREAERRCQAGPHRPQKDGKKRTEQIVALTRGDLQGELDRLFLILSLGGNSECLYWMHSLPKESVHVEIIAFAMS